MTRRAPHRPADPSAFYVPLCNLDLNPGDAVDVLGRGTFVLSSYNDGSWLARPVVDGKRGEPVYLSPAWDARLVGVR